MGSQQVKVRCSAHLYFDFGNSLQIRYILSKQLNYLNLREKMHAEKYSLKWHTYSDHLKNLMKELMLNEDFSDVTLVTEDKKHIKANVNILSACSPVF